MKKLLLLCTLLPVVAFAATPKISIIPFAGPKSGAARDELVGALCDQAECVPQTKVAKGNKPDWAKAKKLKLTHVITGRVVGKKIEVTVFNAAKKPKLKKAYPITAAGKFSGSALESAVADVSKALGLQAAQMREEPKRREEPVTETPVKREEQTTRETTREPSRETTKNVQPPPEDNLREDTAKRDEETPPPTEEEPMRRRARPPLFAVQLGPDFGMRFFTFNDVETKNLRSYKAYFIFLPRLHGELYPLARTLTGIPAGLGLEADYSFAVGLQSSPTGGPTYGTRLSRFDIAARLRMTPTDGPLVINPFIGYRSQSFGTLAATDGSRLQGLPNIDYGALRIGTTVEQPLLDDQAVVYGELALLPVLSTGQLKELFPKAAGFGFEAGVGGGYTIFQKLQARVGFTFTRYGLGFVTDPADTYRASGASDVYGTLTTAVRYTY